MQFVAALADLRARHTECQALVYGDLRTGIVLAFDAEADRSQEDHEALLSTARRLFAQHDRTDVDDSASMPLAAVFNGSGGFLFLRQATDAPEVLGAAFGQSASAERLVSDMTDMLSANG